MNMPETQEQVVAELERVRKEIARHNAQLKWLKGQLNALQSLCSHPQWHHDNDPRMPSSECLVCGLYV